MTAYDTFNFLYMKFKQFLKNYSIKCSTIGWIEIIAYKPIPSIAQFRTKVQFYHFPGKGNNFARLAKKYDKKNPNPNRPIANHSRQRGIKDWDSRVVRRCLRTCRNNILPTRQLHNLQTIVTSQWPQLPSISNCKRLKNSTWNRGTAERRSLHYRFKVYAILFLPLY